MGKPTGADFYPFGKNGRKMVVDSTVPNKEKARKPLRLAGKSGGGVRIRTADPLHAKKDMHDGRTFAPPVG